MCWGSILGRSMRIAITKRKLRQLWSPKFMLWTFVHSERLAIETYGIFRSYTSTWETKQSAKLQRRQPPGIARQPLAQPWGMAFFGSEKLGLGKWTHRTLQDWSPFSGHPMVGGQQKKNEPRPAWSPPSIDSHLPPLGSDLPWPDTQKMHSNPPVIQYFSSNFPWKNIETPGFPRSKTMEKRRLDS